MNQLFNKQAFWDQAEPIQNDTLEKTKRCLIIVPHPDDESLACAGLILTLLQYGVNFKIVLTTDGSRSHPNSKQFPAERLAALRKAELLKALELLGLNQDTLACYGCTDSAMPARGEEGFNEVAEQLAEELGTFGPDLILVPYELDPHRDHRASWQLLMAALEKGKIARPKIWEYPIWLYENAEAGDIPKLAESELKSLNIEKFLSQKMAAIQAHQSQTTTLINDDPEGFILTEDMINNFVQGKEYFLERKKLNPSGTLSNEYFEQLYTKASDPWNFEKSKYEQDKYQNTLNSLPNRQFDSALEIGCSIGVFTEMLIGRCNRITALDLSETALELAKKRLKAHQEVTFKLGAIPVDFPEGIYDLIVMSEVGYYLTMPDLLITRHKIDSALKSNGILILVHWTHFVVDYPISGDEVHECFKQSDLEHVEGKKTNDYRIDVFRRV